MSTWKGRYQELKRRYQELLRQRQGREPRQRRERTQRRPQPARTPAPRPMGQRDRAARPVRTWRDRPRPRIPARTR